jgi:hypothetical protein
MRTAKVRKMERIWAKRNEKLHELEEACELEEGKLDILKREIGYQKAKDCPARRVKGLSWCLIRNSVLSYSYDSASQLCSDMCFRCRKSEGEINVKMLGLKLEKK